MQLDYTFGIFELACIGVFFGCYLLYILRMSLIAIKLKSPFWGIFIKLLLRSAYFGLILLSILGPYVSVQSKKSTGKAVAKDIYIALDRSLSMGATDVPPNRMDRVKNELTKLVKHFKADNIGLILFPSKDSVFCPLTFDKNVVTTHLDIVSPIKEGTDFYPALKTALIKHTQNNRTKADAKLIILVSDGEDFGERTMEVAREINRANIKLFTLGVGTPSGGRIPYRGHFKKDNNGNLVITKLKPESLRKVARETNGHYFELSKTQNDIPKLIQAIEDIKGEVLDTKELDTPLDYKFQYFILAALLLILVDIILTKRIFKI